jgi:hypothetical protein
MGINYLNNANLKFSEPHPVTDQPESSTSSQIYLNAFSWRNRKYSRATYGWQFECLELPELLMKCRAVFEIRTPVFVSILLKLQFFNKITAILESVWPKAILSSAGSTLGRNASLAIGIFLAIYIFYTFLPHFQTMSKSHQPHTGKLVAISREVRRLEHEFRHSSVT